jgi:metal-responsive CopG/Arc/MetJ family transcriptional regulator
MRKIPDRRITVSVAAELANQVDQYVSTSSRLNRSQVVEQALRVWEALAPYNYNDEVLQEALSLYEQKQERELYSAYYANVGESSEAEDKTWSQLSADSAAKQWPVLNSDQETGA